MDSDVIQPKYNGGDLFRFYNFINQEFDFFKIIKKSQIVISFTINVLGEMKDIRILKFPGEEAAAEILRVLQTANKWERAKKDGNPFSIKMKMPINFNYKPKTKEILLINDAKSSNKEIVVNNSNETKPEYSGG